MFYFQRENPQIFPFSYLTSLFYGKKEVKFLLDPLLLCF